MMSNYAFPSFRTEEVSALVHPRASHPRTYTVGAAECSKKRLSRAKLSTQ